MVLRRRKTKVERHFGTRIQAVCGTYDDGGILINPAGRGGRASGFYKEDICYER